MAGRIRMPNKKTTITIAIIVAILAIVAIIGTVVFLKDRGSTEAAEIGNNQSQENGTTGNTPATPETNTNNGEVAGNPETLPNAGEQGNAGNAQNNPVANNGTQNPANGTVNNGGGVQNNQVAGNAGQNAANNIQETTIVENQTVYTETPWETQGVTWAPLSVNANLPLAEIKAEKDALEINKVCETKTGENLTTKGEELTYKITVKNNSGKVLEGIEVKDRIPSQTTYVDNSVDNGGNVTKLTTGKEVVAWTIDLKENEEKTLSFKVIVNATEGTIANVAVVNGEETNETHTAIVTSTKTAEVIGKKAGEPAKVGDKVTYTITVKNTGDVAGKANVKDESLAKLIEDGILEVEEDSKETAEKLMAGADVEVAANSESKVEFTVVVKKVSGAIKNVATIGEEKPEETIDTVNITGTKTNNDTDKVVKPGDEFEYTIKLTNSGNKAGTVKVTDQVPEQLEVIGTTPKATVNGNNVNFGNVTVTPTAEVELKIKVKVKANATGTIANIAKIDDKTEIPDPDPIKTANITGTKTNNDTDKVVRPGDTFDYTITLTNSGNAAGTVTVTDQVPEQLKVTGTNPTATVNGNSVNFGEVEVVPGTPKTLTISVEVKENATGTIANIAKIDGKTEIPDPDPIKTVNITGAKTNNDTDKVVKPGDTFDYTITLTNSGNIAGKVAVTDQVPEQLKVTGTNPTATVNGNSVNFGEVEVAPGTPKTLTISVEVKENATGEIKNIAKIDGKTEIPDPDPIKTVNITGTKTNNDTDKVVKPGDEFEYTIKLTNSGNTTGTVKVTDQVPEQLEVIGTTPTATVKGNSVNFGNVTVTPAAEVELKIKVKVKANATGTIENIAKIDDKTEIPDPDPIKTVNITGTKTNNNTDKVVKPGDTFNYTITLTNSGNTAGKVTVTDEVPAQLKVTGTTPTATVNGNNVNFGEVEVAPGTPKTLTISVEVKENATGTIANIAKIDDKTEIPDPDPIKTVNITGAKTNTITANAEGNKTVKPGDIFDYTITLTNSGNKAGSVTVTDQVPEQLEIKGTNPTATVNGNSVDFGDVEVVPGTPKTLTISVEVKENATGEFTNVAVVGGKDTPDKKVTIEEVVDITGEKTNTITANADGSKTVKPGDEFDYTITLTNSGNKAGEVTVTDEIPSQLEIKGTNPEVTPNGNKVDFGSITVGAGATKTLTISVKVKPQATGEFTNVAVVGGSNTPDKKVTIEEVVNITGEKANTITANEDGSKTVKPGDEFDYTITLTNSGNKAGSVTVTDEVPSQLEIKETNPKVTPNGNKVNFGSITVAAGETKTLTISVKVKPQATGTFKNVAVVGGTNTPDKEITIEEVVNITGTKTNNVPVNEEGNKVVKPGDEFDYTITLTNSGNKAGSVTVTDEVPSQLEIKGTNPEVTPNGNSVNFGSVTLAAGATKTLTISVKVKENATGEFTNVAVVGEDDVEEEKPVYVSNISISKTVVEKTDGVYTELSEEALAKAVYEVGDTVWYAIKVTNNGEVADTATVTDKLPAGLQYVSASETINYNNSTITWNTELTAGQSKTLYIEAKITSDALNGNHTSTITGGDAWWTTDNSNKTIGKQAKTAQLFIRLDGNILGNDQDTTHTNDDYTGCVGTVNLSAKNLTGDDTPTTNENAIKIGSPSTLTTVEEYAQQNYKIFQYIVNGTDLTTIANNIKNDSKAQAKGITFDPETQMIVCYVMKTENDGYHIDAVIRDKSTIRVDLYNLKNVAVTNKEESEVTIKVSDTTELTKVVANKVWADPEHKLDSVDVELYANGIAQDNIQTLSESNGWTYTWEVEKYGNNGNKIDYSVKEISIDTENNTVTEYDDDNVTADNYKVTYETTGNTTTITNEFVQPNISVTKNQYDKDENPIANGTKVQYGDIITYRITATNSGNAEGTVTIKDTVPVNSELVANSIKLIQGTTTTLTETKLNNGVQVTLGANETATLEFTVRATAYAGEKVENTAHYNKDNEEKETPTETTQSNIETKTQVIPTSTSTTVTSAPQKVILVLDYSGSMNYDDGNGNTRVSALKTAANSFLETFLANGKNEVMVIRYATNATLACDFTTSKTDANNAINKNPNGGTNTHAGLEMANQYVDANTSVILMTDGLATYYNSTDWWGNTSVEGKGSGYDATADQKARDTATTIKGKGAKVYSIGFGLDDSRGEAMLQNIATPNTYNADGTIKDQYYFKAMNGDALKKAFEDISESLTTDGVHIPFTTENGKLIITKTSKVTVDGKEETVESFKEGQNVEIYTENYEQGKTEPFRTYTWKQFTELTTGTTTPLVTIAEDGTLTFDLTQYMKDNNIAASKKVTIRFVDPKSEEEEIETAQLMMMVMDIVEEAETDEDIAVYEQKIEEAEKAKTAPVEKDSKEETNTDTNTTNNNTANDNTVVDNKTDNTTSSTDNKEDIKDDTTSTEKPEVSEGKNTTTEEPVINNQNDKTDNTTSITTEE